MNGLPRGWRLCVMASLCCLAMTGCKSNTEDSEAAHTTPEPVPVDAPASSPVEAPPRIEEIGRIDLDGYVFSVEADTLGNVVVTARQGRKAAFLIDPERDPREPAAAVELTDFAHFSCPVAQGLFAIPQERSVILYRVARDGGLSHLEAVHTVDLPGTPAGCASMGTLLWLAVRNTPDGHGLIAIDPGPGTIVHRVESGAMPVSLVAAPDDTPATLFATALGEGGKTGQIIALRSTPRGGLEEVRGPIAGAPLNAFPAPADTPQSPLFVIRHDTSELLPLQRPSLVPTAPIALPFTPSQFLWGAEPGVFYVLGGQGTLARGIWRDDTARIEKTRDVAPRSSELLRWTASDELLLLDAGERALRILDPTDLSDVAVHHLGGEVGRMAIDPGRRRIYVSLPEDQKLVILTVHPPGLTG